MAYPDAYEPLLRFLHIFAGIVWIGHLYFFNFTNVPMFKVNIAGGNPDQKAGPSLMLRAIFWFRWGAMLTLIFGLMLMDAVAQRHGGWEAYTQTDAFAYILVGAGLGIIMWFNVWFIIWPAQKVVLNNNIRIAAGVDDEEKKRLEADNATRAPKAKVASRFNTWASFPMLFFMVFAAHGIGFLW